MVSEHSHRLRTFAVCAALVAATLAAYWPVTGYPLLNWDDPILVDENPHVYSGLTWENVKWSFGIHRPMQWHPLSWLSHQLDCELYGTSPAAAGRHHVTSLVLHIAAALAWFGALKRLTGDFWPSAVVAALFALHPMSVESVAWVAERRDVLSALFAALAIWAYAAYAQSGGADKHLRTFGLYLLTLGLLILGLMSKPILVTLPCVMLLLDYWPLRRVEWLSGKTGPAASRGAPCRRQGIFRLLAEKIPFFACGGVSAWLSYLCESHIWQRPARFSLWFQLANATLSYAGYLGNMLWPVNLSPIYPLPKSFIAWQVFAAGALLLAVTVAAVWAWRRFPYLLVGWLWYLGMLVPVSGLWRTTIDVSMADHFAYLPLLGIYVAVAWGVYDLISARLNLRAPVTAVVLIILLVCILLTRRQVGFWRDSIAMFERALAVAPENLPEVHNNLGKAHLDKALSASGETDRLRISKAMEHFRHAIRIRPSHAEAHNNLGSALLIMGGPDDVIEAIKEFEAALRSDPDYADAHSNLGNALLTVNRTELAFEHYQQALKLQPDNAKAHNNLATAYARSGRFEQAIQQYEQALRLKPDYVNARIGLGGALLREGRASEAAAHFRAALQIQPDSERAKTGLQRAESLLQQGH